MLSLLVFRGLWITRHESEVELSRLSPRLGLDGASVDRVIRLAAVEAEVKLSAPLLLLSRERTARRGGVDGVDVHGSRTGDDWRGPRNERTRRGLESRPRCGTDRRESSGAALVLAFLESLEEAVVDPDGEFLKGFERGWPIVVCEIVLDVRLEAEVKLRPKRVVVPVEQRGKGEEARVVLAGRTGLLEGTDASLGLLHLVDDAEGGVEVSGKGREGVEPGWAGKMASFIEVGLDELEGRSPEVANCIEDLGLFVDEARGLSLEVDPAMAEESAAFAGLGAVECRRCGGFGLGESRGQRFDGGRRDRDGRSGRGGGCGLVGRGGGLSGL